MIKNIKVDFADYCLLDSGDGEKLERFGAVVTRRPEPQAIWRPSLSEDEWRRADAYYRLSGGGEERGEWIFKKGVKDRWHINYKYKEMSLRLRLAFTSFKHLGIFPEQAANWNFIYDKCREIADGGEQPKVLNLFAYTGGASLAARSAGAQVTHVDSVKQVVTWSKENMELSALQDIRWVVEDALKFVQREQRRGNKYHAIILDPPAYGRGANGERWILEQCIAPMLEACADLLENKKGCFVVLNLYSMGLSSTLARTIMHQMLGAPAEEQRGELLFEDEAAGKELPLGVYYRFVR